MTEVSIVIPTYNRAVVLERTLTVLALQDYEGQFEVLLCDDGSADATPELVPALARRLPYPLRYLRQERNGFRLSAARNLGIAAAEATRFVVLLDDDMLVPPEFLRVHAAHLEHPEAVTLGYRFVLEPGEGLGLGFRIAPDPREEYFAGAPRAAFPRWMVAAGCNLALGRALLDLAGPYDERFTGWGAEDNEYAFRLQLLGAELTLVREAFGWHQYDPEPYSPFERLRRRLRPDFASQLANLERFRAKYPDQPEAQAVLGSVIAHLQRTQEAAGTSELLR